ncbi:MAG: hypothetical protein HAW60_00450 [Bdellovibrionales bacterium]|nr:hypothetical protein [Bdellovibrionales bacterium]
MSNFINNTDSLFYINSTENTFVVCESNFLKNIFYDKNNILEKNKIKNICSQYKVDGMAILFASKNYDLQWKFFNADGSSAKMCGNLARGLVYYLSKKSDYKKTEFLLLGPNNIIQSGYIKNNMPFISMPNSEIIKNSFDNYLQDIYSEAFLKNIPKIYNSVIYVCTGVPHALVPIYSEDINLLDIFTNFFNNAPSLKKKSLNLGDYKIQNFSDNLQKIIKKIRNQGDIGFNVTLFNPKTLKAISFERGVENFSLSCGTGACSLSYYLKTFVNQYKDSKEITVKMPGGDLLINVEKKEYLLGGKCKIISLDLI